MLYFSNLLARCKHMGNCEVIILDVRSFRTFHRNVKAALWEVIWRRRLISHFVISADFYDKIVKCDVLIREISRRSDVGKDCRKFGDNLFCRILFIR